MEYAELNYTAMVKVTGEVRTMETASLFREMRRGCRWDDSRRSFDFTADWHKL